MQRPCGGNLVGTFKAQQGGRVAEAERGKRSRGQMFVWAGAALHGVLWALVRTWALVEVRS